MDLFYCAGGNKELDMIALEEGLMLGVRSDRTSYLPVHFVDIDYKEPDWETHIRRVAKEQPKYATVPDLSDKCFDEADVGRAMHQSEQLSNYCEATLIVPKLLEQIPLISKTQALGFSIPTKYGGVKFALWEAQLALVGYRLHLLGGRPAAQLMWYQALAVSNQIISLDGSSATIDARYGDYFDGKRFRNNPNKAHGHHAESWRLSCQGIYQMWARESVDGVSSQPLSLAS